VALSGARHIRRGLSSVLNLVRGRGSYTNSSRVSARAVARSGQPPC